MGCLSWFIRIKSLHVDEIDRVWCGLCVLYMKEWLKQETVETICRIIQKKQQLDRSVTDEEENVNFLTDEMMCHIKQELTSVKNNDIVVSSIQPTEAGVSPKTQSLLDSIEYLDEACPPSETNRCFDNPLNDTTWQAVQQAVSIVHDDATDKFCLVLDSSVFDLTNLWMKSVQCDDMSGLPVRFGQLSRASVQPSARKQAHPYLGDYQFDPKEVERFATAMEVIQKKRRAMNDLYGSFADYHIQATAIRLPLQSCVIIGGQMHC